MLPHDLPCDSTFKHKSQCQQTSWYLHYQHIQVSSFVNFAVAHNFYSLNFNTKSTQHIWRLWFNLHQHSQSQRDSDVIQLQAYWSSKTHFFKWWHQYVSPVLKLMDKESGKYNSTIWYILLTLAQKNLQQAIGNDKSACYPLIVRDCLKQFTGINTKNASPIKDICLTKEDLANSGTNLKHIINPDYSQIDLKDNEWWLKCKFSVLW